MTTAPLAQDVARWRDLLLEAAPPGDEAGLVDLLGELEAVKSAACAVQADLAVRLDDAVRAREAAAGVRPERRGRGVAGQIGLTRQESPHRAKMLLGFARDLHSDLPCTRAALADGRLNEYRAIVVARESGCLAGDDRRALDATLEVEGLGTLALAAEVRRLAYAADPASVVRRHRRATEDRRVSIRPAPDTMTYVSGLLPVAQGVAVFAALTRDADALRAAGDPRSKGQLMADLFVERLTGQTSATAVPICVDLVLSDETLLAGGHEPAEIPGHGPVPAQVARELVAHALGDTVTTWLRKLYADPSGDLVAMTSRQRFAPAGLADYVGLRDAGLCRTPWCDAPIRHVDHVTPVDEHGTTTGPNLQGLCEQCNHIKQAPGWTQRTVPGGRHTVETITPTGRRHRSRSPAPPMPLRQHPVRYRLDIVLPAA